MPADSGMYLEAAVHMHSSVDPTSKHAAYLGSSPEERRTQQLAVSTIDRDTLVKEFTFTIAMRSVQASAAALSGRSTAGRGLHSQLPSHASCWPGFHACGQSCVLLLSCSSRACF